MKRQTMTLSGAEKAKEALSGYFYPQSIILPRRTWLDRFIKRSIDILFSLAVIIGGAPFYLAIAFLIKLTSKGPVFFKQQRVGKDGAIFTLYKFRTMHQNTDDTIHREFTKRFIAGELADSGLDGASRSVYKLRNDPRVTPVGNFLRKTSLDEFPQFLNVLKGEMTIVGPRPPLPYEIEHYQDWHKLRLSVKPGLTGLWQVSGRSAVPFNEMVMLDLYYIEHWSLLLDFKIMLRTIPVMLFGSGGF